MKAGGSGFRNGAALRRVFNVSCLFWSFRKDTVSIPPTIPVKSKVSEYKTPGQLELRLHVLIIMR